MISTPNPRDLLRENYQLRSTVAELETENRVLRKANRIMGDRLIGGRPLKDVAAKRPAVVRDFRTTETSVQAIVFYPAGSLGEPIEQEGG